jgi:ribosomal protein S12 methylthiotransferase accessory factor
MTVTFPGGRRVNARYGGFEIATDQSPKYGGDASAPEPFDLFLASLATCAGAYIAGFCGKRNVSTDGMRLIQRWDRDDKGRVVKITIQIEVPNTCPEKYHDALIRAANQCAVKRLFDDPPEFVVETAVGDVTSS